MSELADDATIVEWGIERAGELLALVDGSYPDDRLTLDEVESACWGENRVVLGRPDGSAAISLRIERDRAVIEVVAEVGDRARPDAVAPELLVAAADYASERAAAEVVLGGPVPDHLWPGLTAWEDDLVGPLTDRGFSRIDEVQVLAVATSYRCRREVSAEIERVVDDDVAAAVGAWVSTVLPGGADIVCRSIAQATCFVALDRHSDDIVGVLAHSVGRDGWIGPLFVADDRRREGLGSRLVSEACSDLMISGLREAPLALDTVSSESWWPAPFLESAGAGPWRTFQSWRMVLSEPGSGQSLS